MTDNELPAGWSQVPLEDCVDILDSRRIPINNTERAKRVEGKERCDLFPYYGATGQVGYIDDYLFDEQLIALGEDGVPFLDPLKPKAYMLNGKTWVNNHAHVLRGTAVENRLLCHFLNQFDYQGYVNGATRLKLTQGSMKKMPVRVPPLAEQTRIANKLDELLAQVDTIKARVDAIPGILKRFRQSVLAAAVSGRLTEEWRTVEGGSLISANEMLSDNLLSRRATWEKAQLKKYEAQGKTPQNDKWKAKYKAPVLPDQAGLSELPESWAWASVENIAADKRYAMSSGPFGSALGTKDYVETGTPVLRGKNVKNGTAGVGDFVFVTNEKADSIERSLAYPDDVIVVAVGSSGVTGIVPPSIEKFLISQNCNKISVDQSLVLPHYLNLFLQAGLAQAQISEKTTDTVRQFFSLTNLKKTLIAIPPMEEQRRIVEVTNTLLGVADLIDRQVGSAASKVGSVSQSILAKAFRGELVPQHPDDEPASVLLERIRGEA